MIHFFLSLTLPLSFALAGYPPDQTILFESGSISIEKAASERLEMLQVLTSESHIGDIRFESWAEVSYSESETESLQPIREFEMGDGGSLRVTPDHLLVIASGQIRLASDIITGQSLIAANGERVPVMEARTIWIMTKIFDVTINFDTPLQGILAVQGYLAASTRFYEQEGFRRLIGRRVIPEEPGGYRKMSKLIATRYLNIPY